jgi:hypothetical protein
VVAQHAPTGSPQPGPVLHPLPWRHQEVHGSGQRARHGRSVQCSGSPEEPVNAGTHGRPHTDPCDPYRGGPVLPTKKVLRH